jgi:hypothetical protein
MMSRSNSFVPVIKQDFLLLRLNDLELGELQQELLGTSISKFYSSLSILTCTFNLKYLTDAKALMLYRAPLAQITRTWL